MKTMSFKMSVSVLWGHPLPTELSQPQMQNHDQLQWLIIYLNDLQIND